ncbi:MAG: HAMP domain-containing histidine kinase [Magnetococcales bacterium]|nr:HAMP domain-containing histidine kinase [Magnetococcales bacterium]
MPLPHSMLIMLLLIGCVVISIIFGLTHQSRKMHQQAMVDHSFLTLLNMVLEVRRFERNYLLSKEKDQIEMVVSYMEQTEQLLHAYRSVILERPDGKKVFTEMSALLAEYRKAFLSYAGLGQTSSQEKSELERILFQTGRQLITISETLAADTEDNIKIILQDAQTFGVLFAGCFILLLIGCGIWFHRRFVQPLSTMNDELSNILSGRQERITASFKDQDFVALVKMINLNFRQFMINQEMRTRMAQQVLTDTILSRLVKMLSQPMANISTSCQILQEEIAYALAPMHREMLTQIQQQAEQGSRLLMAIQEQGNAHKEPVERLNLLELINSMVARILQDAQEVTPFSIRMPENLTVFGNPLILMHGLHDLIVLAMHAVPSGETVVIEGFLRNDDSMREIQQQKGIRSLLWLHPSCKEVVEITVQITIGLQTDQLPSDLLSLCSPGEDGNPGITLLPGILRLHAGGMLAEPLPESRMLLRVWLPSVDPVEWSVQKVPGSV